MTPPLADRHVNPFAGQDIRTLLAHRAAMRGDHPYLVWQPFEAPAQTWTYRRFADRVARFAAGLHRRGVRAGDRVLVHLDNGPETVIAWFGCAWAGAIAVTTNARASADELAYYAANARTVAGITQPRFADTVSRACGALRWLAVTSHDAGEPAGARRPSAADAFESIDADPSVLPARAHDPMAPFSVQYTSGTTSRPKGVLWTHANALWGARINALHEGLRDDDVHLVMLPLFHTNAQAYSMLAALWAGATAVVVPRFSASRFWPTALRHRCTWTSVIPFCVRALAEHEVPRDHAFRRWGSAVCAPPTDAHFGIPTLGWWGMTETITHGIVGTLDGANTPLSIGRPAPEYGIEVRVDGRPAQPGETGELRVLGVRGVSLFAEYLDNPQATADAYDDTGRFITGDRITVGADGALFFADRSKDMLKVGGENVAASEIERVILAVPGVAEAAVVAQRHPMLDEVPVAFVRAATAGGADCDALLRRIDEACAAALADFKRPRSVRLVDAFPRSTLEKIAKAELRAQLARDEE